MELELKLQGPEASDQTFLSLQDWIKKEKIAELKVQKKIIPPKQEHMGADPITILSVVLASTAVVELVKSIHTWIKSTRPKVKIKLQLAESQVIEMEGENLPDLQLLIDKILEKLKEAQE